MTARRLVEADGIVGNEGARLLAFIDTIEDAGMRWSVSTNLDSTYNFHILAGETIFWANGKTIGEAIKEIGRKMVEAGMKGAPSA